MKNITISISDQDLERLDIQSDQLTFSELVRKITVELARDALNASHQAAKAAGLDQLSLEEIIKEVNAYRDGQGHS